MTAYDDIFEVEMLKKKVKLNTPIHVGYFILQYAKLRMLTFYYDGLLRYIDLPMFEFLEMDTDSAYFAIAGQRLDEVIKPLRAQEYHKLILCYPGEAKGFFPRTCCTDHKMYDRRTPGFFQSGGRRSGNGSTMFKDLPLETRRRSQALMQRS